MIMKDELISLFIDDALNLDRKIEFVERVHSDPAYEADTLALLKQESLIREDVTDAIPVIDIPNAYRIRFFFSEAWGYFATAAVTACVIFFLTFPSANPANIPFRFVLYQPDAKQVQISGSFTGWDALPMNPVGNSGYWAITVGIPKGEHRFSYILDGKKVLADPSVPAREKDDFGGENSILTIGV